MTAVLAFDQATTTGWVFGSAALDLREWKAGHFRAPKRQEEGERLCAIEDGALALIDEYHPDLIVLESPYDPTWNVVRDLQKGKTANPKYNAKTMQFLQRVKGAVIMAAARRSIPTEEYQPRSWQACLSLPSKPADADPKWKKRAVLDAVRRLGAKVETFDEADAWGLCYYALHGKPGVKRATEDLFERARAIL